MMNKSLLRQQFAILILAIFLVIIECKVSPELQVTLPHGGGLSGKYMTSLQGRGIRAFLGVPFAEPPIAELRFENPVPKLPWTGYIPVNVDNKMCPQVLGMNFMGDEDCLYLNVFAPLEPKISKPLPVMVFIHGGGFSMGSNGGPLVAPDYFLDHDVILVSGNYRLDALGFLSLDSAEFPGNLGLKDQSLLLQWVQDNILSFGGDPNQVTIFGISAGSASVSYHLLSSLSEKKFQRAILQSGVAQCPWAFDFRGDNLKNAKRLGKELNCDLTDDAESHGNFISCLKSKSAEEIISTSMKFRGSNYYTTFLPQAEIAGPQAFISKAPNKLTRTHGVNIPILIGATSHEGMITTGQAYSTEATWNELNGLIDQTINNLTLATESSNAQRSEIQKLTKEFYFKSGTFEKENVNNVTDFFSDGLFIFPNNEFLVNRLVTNGKAAETFVYLYSHRGAATIYDAFTALMGVDTDVEMDLGVAHGDDILSFFPLYNTMLSHIVPSQNDRFIRETLVELWVNFATTGQPSKQGSPVAWNTATEFPLNYLRVGNYGEPNKALVAMETGLLDDRMKLWRKLKTIANDIRKEGREEL